MNGYFYIAEGECGFEENVYVALPFSRNAVASPVDAQIILRFR